MFIPSSPHKTTDNMLQVELSGQALLNVDKLKVLGVTITHDLQWSSHGNKVRAKIIARMNTIRRFGRILNANIRLQLFNTYVKPHYKYYLPVWGNTNKSIEKKIQQNFKIMCVRYH